MSKGGDLHSICVLGVLVPQAVRNWAMLFFDEGLYVWYSCFCGVVLLAVRVGQ